MTKSAAWTALLAVALAAPAAAQYRESLIDADRYRGLAADHRAYRVGDVITVFVLEVSRARSQAGVDATSELGLDANLRSPTTRYDATLGVGGGHSGGAQTVRAGEVRAQISAQVVAVDRDGRMLIEGLQTLLINGERQQIRLRGLVRPEDIAADNSVLSQRVANADIELVGVGVVSESARQSLVYRALKWLRLL
ncbi:flagellar basal body L-ring protein FlgH [Lysobacter korlensis]|uniref:Flagellar basal body L-ring protein FlgH n=1 Tax=Lysobacter korlensis TaxID=553636 RepID=A0ABV6RN41_9GAMM